MESHVAELRRSPRLVALARLARSPVVIQAGTYAGANILTSAIGGISTILLARNLSTSQYGSYSFANSALAFAAMFFEFGLFLPPARQLARGDAPQREIVAATTVTFLPVGVGLVVSMIAFSFRVDHWFHVDAGAALLLAAPLVLAYPYDFAAFQLAQGLGRINLHSITRVMARVGAVGALVLLLVTGNDLTVGSALVIEAAALLLAWTMFTVLLRPVYRNVALWVRSFLRGARQYGFQVYLGRVLSTGTYNMDTLMVAALTDARSVGFYALAATIAYLVGLPGAGMAAALFSRMANERRVSRSWLTSAWLLGLTGAGLACILVRPFVRVAVGPEYLPVVGLLPPLALAQVIRSVTTVYNTYLTAHARGTELRNAALLLTIGNLVLNFCLIPPFGAVGAAWASLLALLVNLAAHFIFYRRVERAYQQEALVL